MAHISCYYNDYGTGYNGSAMVGDFNWRSTNSYLDYVRDENRLSDLSHDATHIGGQALDQV